MKVGDKIYYKTGFVRLMAIAENWAMVRRPRAIPFCVLIKELEDHKEDYELMHNKEFVNGIRKIIEAVETTEFDFGKCKPMNSFKKQ